MTERELQELSLKIDEIAAKVERWQRVIDRVRLAIHVAAMAWGILFVIILCVIIRSGR